MLTAKEERPTATPQLEVNGLSGEGSSSPVQSRIERVLRVEWLGQTVASLCWIASVLAYGISSSGDWLQLFAASSWLVANIAAVATARDS